jgi:hypothetical protein
VKITDRKKSIIVTYPSLSISPMSPVWNHPSSSITSFVASLLL